MTYTSTPTHGKVARLEKGDTAVDYIGEWNLEFNLDMATQERQGQHWKNHSPGQAGWGGSARGHAVLGNTQQKALHDNLVTATPGTKLTDMKFLIDGSAEGWSGDLYVTSIKIGAGVTGIVSIDMTFMGDGEPTLSDQQ